jgi:hypothetical protein
MKCLLHSRHSKESDTVREEVLKAALKKSQVCSHCKATSCIAATSVHALPRVCRWLAFLCPMWQRPASSTMVSLKARSLFLLEKSALKLDLSGVERQRKHDIFKCRYQLGEFHHLYNESTKFFQYCRMSPSTFDYIVQAIWQHISHNSTNFQRTTSMEERLFVTLR